jgi:spore coat protein U-like protein
MKRIIIAAGVAVLLAGSTPSRSDAALHRRTSALQVRGSVSSNCSLGTQPISFTIGVGYLHGSSNPPVTKSSSLLVRCTKGAVVQIAMNTGLYGNKAGSQFGSRSMKSSPGKSYLGYELCHDQGCAGVWTPAGYSYTSPTDAGSSLPVWARIKTGQQVDTGSYSDSVTVTVNF